MRLELKVVWLLAFVANVDAQELTVQRLTWAGVKMVHGDTTVFVDAVGKDLWDGNAPGGLVPVTADTGRRYALVTHPHNDHFDPDTLMHVLGERGYVICHESVATHIASRGLRVIPVKNYEPIERGGYLFMAVPAQDGFGDSQVSWIITVADRRFLHAGDTLWHGKWKLHGDQYGPFDSVFLPINAARIQMDPMPVTPAVMGPQQAIDAALMLSAKRLVPIHFGLNEPPYYIETPGALEATLEEGAKRGVTVKHLKPGDYLDIASEK